MPRPPLSLTLIVATTPSLGIGKNGQLPWRLRKELQYFARVTTRIPASFSPAQSREAGSGQGEVQNAVVMGRKTWESIPPAYRPLKGRVNVVLSNTLKQEETEAAGKQGFLLARNLDDALAQLQRQTSPRIARVFVIGGHAVYQAALRRAETRTVLLTRVFGDRWDCDTYFPEDLDEDTAWMRVEEAEWREWTGEQEGDVRIKEGDVEFEYRMYNRRQDGE